MMAGEPSRRTCRPVAVRPRPPADPGGRRRCRPDAPDDPLLRRARPAQAGRPIGGRLPPLRRRRSRAAALHQGPPRRRRVQPGRDRPAARGRGRASPEPRALPDDEDPAERRAIIDDAIARVDRQVASLRAEDRSHRGDDRRRPRRRRAHLEGHSRELDAGASRAARTTRPVHRSARAPMTITFHGARAFRHRNYRLFFGGQADLAGRDVDAAGRPGLARPPADPRPALARPDRRSPSSGR